MKRKTLPIFMLVFLLLPLISSIAGNLPMVEKQVKELDDLNKEAVGQIQDLPSSGKVAIKAHVTLTDDKPRIEILEKNVTQDPVIVPITTPERDSNQGESSLREEPIDYRSGYTLE
jgi:hypothetical protein